MSKIIEHNTKTGKITERDLTAAEIKEQSELQNADLIKMESRVKEIEARKSLLERLGITEEEAKLLLK
jgi:hypothetical protein